MGISNALADPTLELHDASGALIQTNDNWKDVAAQADELRAIGIAPSNDLESAIVATFPPGAYTAIVTGKDAGTGVGLVENLQPAVSEDTSLAQQLADIRGKRIRTEAPGLRLKKYSG